MRKGILLLVVLILIIVGLGWLGWHLGRCFHSPHQAVTTSVSIPADQSIAPIPLKVPLKPLNEIKAALQKLAPTLSANAIETVITTLKCADKNNIDHNQILTVIDYSLPSNEKRLWVFDLSQNTLLFHTYVSHGIQSGTLLSTYFSNKNNGKASSIGIFNTDKAYRGRHGESLKLYGLDKNFNDNAYHRFIVMHGAWYVEEWFIKKYGRPGRSWGCPVLPRSVTESVIETIKDKALLVVYYPSHDWFEKSKFLTCEMASTIPNLKIDEKTPQDAHRGAILYININHHDKRQENDPVVIISADEYKRIFNREIPLERMLRRQINHVEYIVLNRDEFKQLGSVNKDLLNFAIPEVKMQRGYYVTEMKFVPLGHIKNIAADAAGNYVITFDHRSAAIKEDDRFIRWVGL